jgi:hypothetical protein
MAIIRISLDDIIIKICDIIKGYHPGKNLAARSQQPKSTRCKKVRISTTFYQRNNLFEKVNRRRFIQGAKKNIKVKQKSVLQSVVGCD